MLFTDIKDLEKKINQFRVILHQTVKETSLNSLETVNCSQQLDQLILIHQKLSYEKK
ncbi:aspartyl-phosphate phosphatase Spo0E family protein [Bacillus sp. OTU530]|uniref:aspartyl-phosphate phosphatase Spo0E family protein n=1 Tax=Bacillus sp. OTU530 TaxID=3043862 RepID=UPI00313BAFFA